MTFHCACNVDERECGYPNCHTGKKLAAPPAQEDEPVAWIRGSGLAMLKEKGPATVFASEGCSNYSIPLYTRPDNLRKAAQCVMLEWDKNRDIYAAIQILRAALRENYGIKAETQ